MGITSCDSFNLYESFLLATIYFVHIKLVSGIPLARLCPGLQREGHRLQSVRPGLPWQSPPALNKNERLKATPALGVSEPFCLTFLRD